VDHISVLLEHVHFVDCLDGLNIKFLECALQFLVVSSRSLRSSLDLSSRGPSAAGGELAAIRASGGTFYSVEAEEAKHTL
jgi:hypothetical protein